LNKEDVVTVYSILDFVEEYKITIDGEIKNREYNYEGLTLNDLLVQAGGLTGPQKRVEVARMICLKRLMMPILIKPNCLILITDNNEQPIFRCFHLM
jgi:hypothetical protein